MKEGSGKRGSSWDMKFAPFQAVANKSIRQQGGENSNEETNRPRDEHPADIAGSLHSLGATPNFVSFFSQTLSTHLDSSLGVFAGLVSMCLSTID